MQLISQYYININCNDYSSLILFSSIFGDYLPRPLHDPFSSYITKIIKFYRIRDCTSWGNQADRNCAI